MANSNIVELCILSDATLSMGPYIKQVKEDIGKIISQSRYQFGIDAFRVAFVAYRDWIGDGERLETLPFTTNIPLFETFVSNLKEEGGDDAAEDVLGGLETAINLKWTAPIKILYHICDAPPHGTMYHDLFDTKMQQIDSMLSTLSKMMSMEEEDDDKDESSDDDVDDYNNSFIQSKVEYKLSDKERIKLDRYPDKHVNDADHNDLLKLIKNKGIEYCIGAKTSHVDKFIKIMISDGLAIDLKVNQMEIPDITALFPSVLRSIECALRIKEEKDEKEEKVYRPFKINRKGNFKVHCGIDFGTDGSAISLLNPQTNKVLIHQWGSNKQNTKTKTNILISPKDGKVLAFGSDAADLYSNLAENAAESSGDEDSDYDDEKANNAPMFFEHFKMLLYKHSSHINQSNVNAAAADSKEEDKENEDEDEDEDDNKCDIAESIRAVGGRTYSSSKILIAALRFMKDKVMSIVKRKPYFITDIEEIQWIVSVPAIWSNKAKYIMERCAENADMINKKKNIENHLLIAYEPDCASISIRNSYSDMSTKYNKKNKTHGTIFNVSDRYLLLDLGGGTADCASHEILDAFHVKQIRAPSGGPWGSAYIDKEFEKLLRKVFKAKWIDNFEKKYPDKYVKLLRSFRFRKERFKFGVDVDSRRFDDNFYRNNMEIFTMNSMAFIQYASQNKSKQERKFHDVSLPFEFVEEIGKCIERDTRRVLKKGMPENNDSDSDNDMKEHEWIQLYLENFKLFGQFAHLIKSDKDKLYFEESIFRYLFDLIIDKIIEHCKYLLSQIKEIKYICLVGGFSESKYLQSKIFYEFGPSSRFKVKILTPKRPILCVVDGAARYGERPDYISSRTVSKTYGLSIQKSLYQFMRSYPNIKIKDDQIVTIDNNQWVNNCFLPFVRKNDVIRLEDEPKVFYFEPSDKNADKIIIKLYESDEINPVFTEDDGKNSKLCAKKEYNLPKGWQEQNDSIPVRFFFGDSTIRVFVDLKCIDNDNEKEIRLDFDTSIN